MQRVRSFCGAAFTALSRTKTVDVSTIHDTELKRCLGVIDLTALGVGNTVGAGLYVLAAEITRSDTGPAVIISFTIAAIATLLSALCYAEFATRVPRAGSAYVYSYVSVGELLAFIIGWNMLLENIIGASASGKACSQYIDALMNDSISKFIKGHVGEMDLPSGFDRYPDFLAMALLLLGTLFISLGVKITSNLNMVLTVVTLAVVIFIVGVGIFYIHPTNWTESPGGFFPYGATGVVQGAAACFFAYIGFDTIATSGEESSKPTKHVPIAIVSTLAICLACYVSVSSIMTLLVPWNTLAGSAALPKAFSKAGASWAMYVIAVGGVFGLVASMLGSIFPLPRAVYAMAQDGVIFRFLGAVNHWTNTPFIATWVCGIIVVVWALLFDLMSLVQMMSIGTLMAYTLVAVSILSLHYQREQVGLLKTDHEVTSPELESKPSDTAGGPAVGGATMPVSEDSGLLKLGDVSKTPRYDQQQEKQQPDQTELGSDNGYVPADCDCSVRNFSQLLNFGDEARSRPTARTKRVVMVSLLVLVIFWAALCILVLYGCTRGLCGSWWAIITIVCCLICVIGCCVVIVRQPRSGHEPHFEVPFVPWTPILSVMANVWLMIALSATTWIRFVVWLTFGMIIYLGYGVWHSSERRYDDTQVMIMDDVTDKDSAIADGVNK